VKINKLSNASCFDNAVAIASALGEDNAIPNRDAFLREAGRAESQLKGGATCKGGAVKAQWNAAAIAILAGLPQFQAPVWASIWHVAVSRNQRAAIEANSAE